MPAVGWRCLGFSLLFDFFLDAVPNTYKSFLLDRFEETVSLSSIVVGITSDFFVLLNKFEGKC